MITMPIWEQLIPWLTLQLTPNLTNQQIIQLLEHIGKPEHILTASAEQLQAILPQQTILSIQKSSQDPLLQQQLIQTQAWLNHNERHSILTLNHTYYPHKFRRLAVPPPVLFASGDLSLLSTPQVLILGSERPSIQGKGLTERFSKSFSLAGWTVVSGLELGINSASLYGALSNSHNTISISTTGLNQNHPVENKLLIKQLENYGLLLSEKPLFSKHLPDYILRRNELLIHTSHCLLVIETSEDSTLYTSASLALQQGIPVFAVPGSIGNSQSKGCHSLIRKGAILIDDPAQIMESISVDVVV